MQSIEITGLKEIQKAFERFPELVKKAKGDMFEDLGREVLHAVRREIGGSGRVAGVQAYYVGSGRGYVAVRAMADTELEGYAAGYITNALENGHDQTPGRYVPALGRTLKRTRVSGKHMYQTVSEFVAPRNAGSAAERLQQKIMDEMFG